MVACSKKRVAVIGAGASGLTAIKCCQDEGLDVVCYERSHYVGGLWHYTDEVEEHQASVMKSTVINTDKEMMAYSDFPMPEHFPIYLHNKGVDQYLNMYADHFDVRKYIKLNHEVLFTEKSDDFIDTGRWKLEVLDKEKNKKTTEIFDAILVCTGHHAEKNVPSFPGLENFQGRVLHSHDYKHLKGYQDKRVLVVGLGNSGGDIAVELSRVADQVIISTRSGSFIINRIGENGDPIAFSFNTRYTRIFTGLFPGYAYGKLVENIQKRVDHVKYGLFPKFPGIQHPTANDDLPNRIATGTVRIRPNIAEVYASGVKYEDGTTDENIDVIVLATGYIFGFPFIDKSIIDVKKNEVSLFKYMFPPELEHSTLAVIGCFQPLGAIMPISEMQSRLATRVFKSDVYLPTKEAMVTDIIAKREAMAKVYMKRMRHTIQVEYIEFMDELALLVGCKPNFVKLLFRDPRLAFTCYFGPCTPYQFRLMGPGSWTGAREAIMTQLDRTYYPLNKHFLEQKRSSDSIARKRKLVQLMTVCGLAGTGFYLFKNPDSLQTGYKYIVDTVSAWV